MEAPIPPGVAYSLNYTDMCGLAQALAGSPAAAAVLSPAPPVPHRHLLAGGQSLAAELGAVDAMRCVGRVEVRKKRKLASTSPVVGF